MDLGGLDLRPCRQPPAPATSQESASSAQDIATESTGTAETGRTGHYVITGLSKGAYQVTFTDCGHFPPRWGSIVRAGAVLVTGRHAG